MTGHGVSRLSQALVWAAVLAAPALAQNAPAPAAPKIDLKLFENAEVDRSKGCSFALWQANRNPERDRYAYIFVENLGRNSVRENARIKVGNEVITFRRTAVGGAQEFGNKTFPNALYKGEKDASYLILDLKLVAAPGEVLEAESGTMTVIRPGFPPFVAEVKGELGCNIPTPASTPATPPPPPAQKRSEAQVPATLAGPAIFEKYKVPGNKIPRGMIALAEQKMSCVANVMRRGATGYAMSEESALWEIPCDSFVYQGHSVFAIVYTPDPAKQFEFVMFDAPKGKTRSTDANQLMTPSWDMKNQIVTGLSLGRAQGDCGTLERHKLGADGHFTLIEYREKENCDGKTTPPQSWPVVYQRR